MQILYSHAEINYCIEEQAGNLSDTVEIPTEYMSLSIFALSWFVNSKLHFDLKPDWNDYMLLDAIVNFWV